MRIENVTSAKNPKIKELLALRDKSRLRRKNDLFIVEGLKETEHCLNAGFKASTLFVCGEILGERNLDSIVSLAESANPGCGIIAVPSFLYEKIAYRGSTEGIIAEIIRKEKTLDDIKLGSNPLIVILETVEKPGNIGAVLRSADAAGADAVIICDPLTDIYNPNIIRASIGAVFTVQTAAASNEDTFKWLKSNGISIYTAQLQDSSPYYDTDMSKPAAIVAGTESSGLTDFWRKAADRHIMIPMLGKLDSLNVSVSAAILLYEAVRQRNTSTRK
ncbi:MAG: RNA methyltransferase [Bacteroidales bacterium]|jgi:TrmH family RNA methyltransferase|nr:RNA methyltransferase [Bacteroidales bacterium]MCI1785570.1 RNA methyltransferase [Bacteroidales bacterium]